MAQAVIHRFHDVTDESRWRTLFAAWRQHLQGLWDRLDHEEVPWAWSERTNVGLLASAHERTPGGWSMVELPIRRGQRGEGAGSMGRFDLWIGSAGWSVHAEAKLVWAPSWGRKRIRSAKVALENATAQATDLVDKDWTETVASLVFVVPYCTWTKHMSPDAVAARFAAFEGDLWASHGAWANSFQTHYRVPLDQIAPLPSMSGKRPRAFPGVILCGRIHKIEHP